MALCEPIVGHGFRLRCVDIGDAEFLLALRGKNTARTQFLNAISSDLGAQQRYITKQRETPNDFYFAIENIHANRVEGFVGLYNESTHERSAEWGRWVLSPQSMASAESTALVFDFGFNARALDTIYCHTLAENLPVVSNHDSFGLLRGANATVSHNGNDALAIRHELHRAHWPSLKAQHAPMIERIAKRLERA